MKHYVINDMDIPSDVFRRFLKWDSFFCDFSPSFSNEVMRLVKYSVEKSVL